MHYVYVLKSDKVDELYIGQTNDLKRRFIEHNAGKNISTKHKTPFKLVYYEAYQSKSDAKHREVMLKRFSGSMTHLKKRIKNSIVEV
ncbi:MAG: GIY-YIG nuclease family protein [Candidatus Zambryskibacteria bacterium]|nr:GIY-YIG nuclease family protein [Candidatus Zambryskibacteria bacterium]